MRKCSRLLKAIQGRTPTSSSIYSSHCISVESKKVPILKSDSSTRDVFYSVLIRLELIGIIGAIEQ